MNKCLIRLLMTFVIIGLLPSCVVEATKRRLDSPQVLMEAAQKVKKGMSMEQVTAIMGTSPFRNSNNDTEVWVYAASDKRAKEQVTGAMNIVPVLGTALAIKERLTTTVHTTTITIHFGTNRKVSSINRNMSSVAGAAVDWN
jgi:outer membrane protein assembly factor BamE (lipoprotein component of BamABCDE complex)